MLLSRIYDFDKRKTSEVAVHGANLIDSMFTHQHGRVQIMNAVAANFGQFVYCLS